MIALLAAALLIQSDAAKDTVVPSGVWLHSESVSPLDGKRSVTQTLVSSSQVRDVLGRPTSALFMLKCSNGDITPAIAWPGGHLGTGIVWVEWRVDNSRIKREQWSVVAGMTNAAIGWKPRGLLDAIRTGRQLVMRVHGYGNTQDVVFELGQSAPAVDAVRAACAKR